MLPIPFSSGRPSHGKVVQRKQVVDARPGQTAAFRQSSSRHSPPGLQHSRERNILSKKWMRLLSHTAKLFWLVLLACCLLPGQPAWAQSAPIQMPVQIPAQMPVFNPESTYQSCVDATCGVPMAGPGGLCPDACSQSFACGEAPFWCEALDPSWHWPFLPQGFLYHTYWASAAEPRLSTQIFHEQHEGTLLDSQIAGRLGIVRFGQRYAEEGIQFDVIAGAKLRQDVDDQMNMVGTDYRFDLPLTYRRGQHAWKFGFYHISAHTGDEYLLTHPGFNRLNFYRDALYLGYSYYVVPELRIYGELDYAFDSEYSEPWALQFGLDYGPATTTGIWGAPFFAINGHLRQELDFGGNVNIQGGWAWRGEGLAAGTLRTGPYYYNGGSPQFSFYATSEQQIGWGVWYDF